MTTYKAAHKQEFENNKLAKRLRREVGQAIADFNMIEEGDRVMVCLSGGKDSFGLLDVLLYLKEKAPINFEIIAVNLDQKQPGFPAGVLPAYLDGLGIPYRIVEEDTYSIVKRVIPEGKTTCSLCSRLRRGILYRVADELGATKIALGHHRDDILATLFLNLFFAAKLKAMPPKLVSDDGRHIVIRPLAYCQEKDLIEWARVREFPIIPCNLCGSQPNLQRQQVGAMLRDWDRRFPGRVETLFRSLSNVVPSHLMDARLYDFAGLKATGIPDPEGDTAFDPDAVIAVPPAPTFHLPIEIIMNTFNPPERTLMGPGPSNINPRVLAALSRPVIGHLDPAFVGMMEELKVMLRYAFQTGKRADLRRFRPRVGGHGNLFRQSRRAR